MLACVRACGCFCVCVCSVCVLVCIYSIAPRIPPGRVEGQDSLKADVSKQPVVVVVVTEVSVMYTCSFIAFGFCLAVDSYATQRCLGTILFSLYYMKLTTEPFVFKLRRFFAVLARSVGALDGNAA